MRLLGVYIRKKEPAVTKILTKGWYPFGDYPRPKAGKGVVLDAISDVHASLYNNESLPNITVNSIVGKNGAGKSTLLDIVYRIINNFTITLLGNKRIDNQHSRILEYADGVNADLYYELEGEQYCICCKGSFVKYYKVEDSCLNEINIQGKSEPKDILSGFFYTISNNYSIYSFNETVSPVLTLNKRTSFAYLRGLFHKNDGYFTPIVVTPFRDNGSIDVERENNLSRQRVVALSLLAYSQGTSFVEAYNPVKLSYELNQQYQEQVVNGYYSYIDHRYKGFYASLIAETFSQAWEKVLTEEIGDEWNGQNMDEYNVALFYLGYKTLKTCMTYDDFWNEFDVDNLLCYVKGDGKTPKNNQTERYLKFVRKKLPLKCEKVIKKIIGEIEKQGGSHITLKIEETLKYIKAIVSNQDLPWPSRGEISVEELVGSHKLETYNDAVELLPPAFFNYDMTFSSKGTNKAVDSSWNDIYEREEFTFEEMSSGERQMLTMLSYVMYHIKNIQSVKIDENRVKYHHICLIFDEAELYFHPDYQRRFLSMLLESLSWCHIDTTDIKSIQIIIVTHSPFVLSDMLNDNILYLEKGKVCKHSQDETFGANLYQLMNQSFYFTENAMGKVASQQLTQWIQLVNNGGEVNEEVLSIVGDTIIRNYLIRKMEQNKVGSCID